MSAINYIQFTQGNLYYRTWETTHAGSISPVIQIGSSFVAEREDCHLKQDYNAFTVTMQTRIYLMY